MCFLLLLLLCVHRGKDTRRDLFDETGNKWTGFPFRNDEEATTAVAAKKRGLLPVPEAKDEDMLVYSTNTTSTCLYCLKFIIQGQTICNKDNFLLLYCSSAAALVVVLLVVVLLLLVLPLLAVALDIHKAEGGPLCSTRPAP